MNKNNFVKQPNEQFYISGSILNNQASDEKIELAGSSAVITDEDGVDVTTDLKVISSDAISDDPKGDYVDNMYQIGVQAGTAAGSPYKITFLLDTNKNNVYEVDVQMTVREI